MNSQTPTKFARRLKIDGLDSICPHCFVTIGSAPTEDELEHIEREHVCNPALLERVNRMLRVDQKRVDDRKARGAETNLSCSRSKPRLLQFLYQAFTR